MCATPDSLQASFLALAPRIVTHARIYFRDLRKNPSKLEEAVAETVAIAWKWYGRLVERGKDVSKFASVFAARCAQAVRNGRRVTGMAKAKDVMNPACQKRRGFQVETLPLSVRQSHEGIYGDVCGQRHMDAFEERLQDNTMTPVPDQVVFRVDFPAWMQTLSIRDRHVVRDLMHNERTSDVSRRYGLSPARISQLRRQFKQDWEQFGDEPTEEPLIAA